jgi:uncharacterized repeat protein (TIGR02543 family)
MRNNEIDEKLADKTREVPSMNLRKKIGIAVLLLCLVLPGMTAAGNISATDKYAWSETSGWNNFVPTSGETVTVYHDHLEGYAWAENSGWIKLGSHTGGGTLTYANTSTSNWGVNLSAGNLSGYGWSENAGWINFSPTGGGVTINMATGVFDGYAWSENLGWIHFKGSSPAYNVAVILNTVTYNGNGNDGGSAPTDSNSYLSDDTVTVLGAGTLTKTGYTFSGWNTAAGGGGTSYAAGTTFTITANTTLYAQWTINTYTLTVTKDGTGSGTVTSSPTGISCGSTCSYPFNYGTHVDISAEAASGSTFTGFTGSCISNTSPCTVVLSEARAVTATFNSKAEFTGSPTSGSVPLNVSFTDTSTHSPTSWSWTFGDGGTSTVKNPVHTYRTNGTYEVTLTATGAGGASTMTKTGFIIVSGTCSNPPYKIGGTPHDYDTIQHAYDPMGSTVMQIQALVFTGDLTLNQDYNITLQGGYDCDFSSNAGESILSDKLTIQHGKVTIEKIIIK